MIGRILGCALALVLLGPGARAAADPPPFAAQTAPPAPDYAQPASWAARPGAEGAASAVVPGATPAIANPPVDVFYVHPTTDRSHAHWNQDIADEAVNGWTDASAVTRQAGVFNGCCRVFAPRYRQASSLALAHLPGDGDRAYDLALGDVVRAFDYYLRHDNHGRPFILAGHSQGAYHLARLIEQRIDGTVLAKQMVAAYLIGYNLSEGDFGKTYKTVPVCAKPAQTGCIVQWNSVLPSADLPKLAISGEARYVARYGDDPGKRVLCVNPLTFDTGRPAADRGASRGAVPGAPGYGPLSPLRVGAVSAACHDGWLVVDPDPALGLPALPGGSMHFHDIGLFYADLRANAALRIAAHRQHRHIIRPIPIAWGGR